MKKKSTLYKFYISTALLALAFLTTLPRFFQILEDLAVNGGLFLLLAGPGLWLFIKKMNALHRKEELLLAIPPRQTTAV
ncbi:MAG TPA: hypothetical protein H9914_09335 [Candidatus Blautia avicola]|uniref:Uncharacterized protein n=1 Tax=Candidatus Blautia avicola TaxID=2838483 RepID=A0A9D2QXJ3_9FIRM|nr:hypothetical protein [Candidatus Blautia avicola]